MRLLLDSAFVIDHLRGLPEAVNRMAAIFDDGDDAYVTDVVVCEVRAGLRAEDEGYLRAVLEPIEIVQPGPEGAILAGRWRAELRSRGRTLSLPDALIGSAAESLGAAILTRNIRDFSSLPVPVETY